MSCSAMPWAVPSQTAVECCVTAVLADVGVLPLLQKNLHISLMSLP
jgi:hypothetical protein